MYLGLWGHNKDSSGSGVDMQTMALMAAEGGDVKLHNGNGERREHMFDKVVTPSDVGKLNRLVVPKHFAKKYFPLAAAGAVLCFEDARGVGGGDRVAKAWSFRFCYWGSSQSYVMTKGWSRFVRQKGLAAGDTVSFFRAPARASSSTAAGGADQRGSAAPAAAPHVVLASTQALAVQRLVTVTGSKEASQFVREKGLVAGETLSFSGAGARFLSDCRRRGSAAPSAVRPVVPPSTQAVAVQRLVTPSNKAGGRSLRLFGVDFELGAQASRQDMQPDFGR